MTTQEKIEVMQGFVDGKQIEFTEVERDNWREYPQDLIAPSWNWERNNYRIKPEKKYRPYTDANEMIADGAKRFVVGDWPSIVMPMIWVRFKDANAPYLVCGYLSSSVAIGVARPSFSELLDDYTYLDGSPCGKEMP